MLVGCERLPATENMVLISPRLVSLKCAGLHREDLMIEELPGVKEALRRLPEEVTNARYFRIKRVGSFYSQFFDGLRR